MPEITFIGLSIFLGKFALTLDLTFPEVTHILSSIFKLY